MKPIKKSSWLLFTVASGTIFNPLNSSMISVALPRIQSDFQLSYTTVSWLISSYYLSSAIAQPVMGKIGDQFGTKKMFLVGLLLVAVSAVAAPWAPTFLALLLLRLFQSVGSSSIFPSGVSIIHRNVQNNQASAMAVIAVCNSATAALGPTIGGFLVALGDWPAIFTVNFPLLLLSFALGWFFLPSDPKESKQPLREILCNFDVTGIILFALTTAFSLWFLLSLDSQVHPISGLAGLVFLVAFIWREMRTENAFIDIRFFCSHSELAIVYGQFIVLNIFFYALFFGLPTYFQGAIHLDPSHSGLLMLFVSGCSVLVSPVTGKWIDRVGIIWPLLAGSTCLVVSAVLLAVYFINASVPVIGAILSIAGVSYGVLNVTLQAAMMKLSPPAIIGVSSGLFQTSRYLGSILSSVVLGLVFGSGISSEHMQSLGYALIIISLIGWLIGFYLWKRLRVA